LGSSRDPSPPLPFWDKIRLIYHGRLTMIVNELKVKLHASLDPYNTTEEMELNWYNTAMDWTNGNLILDSERSDECIDFTMMCVFYYYYYYYFFFVSCFGVVKCFNF
jgi:hypothetical protein